MPVTITVGGQWGGEGKGAVAGYLAQTGRYSLLVKTGGPNSTHSFGQNGKIYDVRMVPSGAPFTQAGLVFPPGCLIHTATLLTELNELKPPGLVYVDPSAGIIDDSHAAEQQADPFYINTGSTRRGTGAASASRARRRLRLARDEPLLRPYLTDTHELFRQALEVGQNILIEGGQGYGLSNYHGEYPYVTSRDTTASAMLSQAGIGMRHLGQTIMCVKSFPTRNPEGDGALRHELDLAQLPAIRNHITEIAHTTALDGRRTRRVGLFDFPALRRAVFANSPTGLAITGLDRLEKCLSDPAIREHYGSIEEFKSRLSSVGDCPIALEGWGPFTEDMKENADYLPIA